MSVDTERLGWRVLLPFPPSTNRYWRHVGPRTLLSRDGRDYQGRVAEYVALAGRDAVPPPPHRVSVVLVAPDQRRRDIDNYAGKALLDALYRALELDDSSVIWLQAEWRLGGPPRAEVWLRHAEWRDGRVTW